MISFGYRNRVAVAVSANAGTDVVPDLVSGLGQTDVDTDALGALLGFRISVMTGTVDVATTGRITMSDSRTRPRRRCRPVAPGR